MPTLLWTRDSPYAGQCSATRTMRSRRAKNERLPVEHGAIQFAIHRQISPFVGKLFSQLFVVVHSESGCIAGMQAPILEEIFVRKYFICLLSMPHIFLDAKIV